MRNSYFIALIGIILVILFLSGCVQKTNQNNIVTVPTADFKIISSINYNGSLCSSSSYGQISDGFDTGLRVVLKDKDTGENLEGYGTFSNKGGGGSLSLDNSYTCNEQTDYQGVIVSVYSKGYSPVVFELNLPKNKMESVEIFMMKSCLGGPSCIDNLKVGLLDSVGGNQTKADEIIKSSYDYFFNIIEYDFGINKSDYELSCMECDMGRGGYIKAKGIYKDGQPLELYYHWGWCSSGGTDCGWDTCFASASETIFESVKTKFCGKVSFAAINDGNYGVCTSKAFDNTVQVKSQCLAGDYETNIGNEKIFSIKQISNRCSSSVEKNNFDCLGN